MILILCCLFVSFFPKCVTTILIFYHWFFRNKSGFRSQVQVLSVPKMVSLYLLRIISSFFSSISMLNECRSFMGSLLKYLTNHKYVVACLCLSMLFTTSLTNFLINELGVFKIQSNQTNRSNPKQNLLIGFIGLQNGKSNVIGLVYGSMC